MSGDSLIDVLPIGANQAALGHVWVPDKTSRPSSSKRN